MKWLWKLGKEKRREVFNKENLTFFRKKPPTSKCERKWEMNFG